MNRHFNGCGRILERIKFKVPRHPNMKRPVGCFDPPNPKNLRSNVSLWVSFIMPPRAFNGIRMMIG
eukprot:scaffold5684_cov71-Cylindrotheca_fusiformis.AAC.1